MNKKTKVQIDKFAGKPLLCIKEVDEFGDTLEKSVVQFGLAKAKAIVKHIEEIKEFIENNDKK